jgi:hypothetical protein
LKKVDEIVNALPGEGGLMGYSYWVDSCDFGIKKTRFKEIWELAKEEETHDAENHAPDKKFIESVFDDNGFDCVFGATGDLVGIEQTSDRLGDEDAFFAWIGEYVDKDSHILCRGEDGTIWRWRFDGVACYQEDADIVFQTNSDECPLRLLTAEKNPCTTCPLGLICLCETNPRLRSAICGKCDGEIIIDTVENRILAGTTCTCQPRRFLVGGHSGGGEDSDRRDAASEGGGGA